jgi:hypothetical protein
MKLQRLALVFAFLSLSARAYPQTTPPPYPMFVDVALAADLDPNTYSDSTDAQPALQATFGVRLPRGFSFRFEYGLPKWHAFENTTTGCCGMSFSTQAEHRIVTYSFLMGRDFELGRRVTFTPLVGYTVASHQDRGSVTTEFRRADGSVVSDTSDDSGSETVNVLTIGVESAIAVSPRIALVPSVRLHTFPGTEGAETVVRPAVGVRWSF